MTKERVLEVIDSYRKYFERHKIKKEEYSHERFVSGSRVVLSHCYGMLDQMEQFVREDKMDKVFRWLGFIQGCFWATGRATLEKLKDDNRSRGSQNG